MNLHEECLLKYLINSADLSVTTELLKKYNEIIANGTTINSILAKTSKLSYSTVRS